VFFSCILFKFACLLLVSVCPITDLADDKGNEEKHIMPYWNMWSSDFYGWMEELRAQAAYDTLLDLARTYWAHFPIASYLGYDSIPNENDQTEKETNN
uniref:Otospiralin n=1 Tax=Pygocentrus nattereri TaxID=42514 RepID=A0A3B4BWV7_PYGNA